MLNTSARAGLWPALTLAAVAFAGGCNSSQSQTSGRNGAGVGNSPPPVDQPSVSATMAKPAPTMAQPAAAQPAAAQPAAAQPAAAPAKVQQGQAAVQEAKTMKGHGEQLKAQGDETGGQQLIEQAKVKEAQGTTQLEKAGQPQTKPE